MANDKLPFYPPKPKEDEEEAELQTLDSLPYLCNFDSDLCSPRSNLWFPEFSESPSSSDPSIHDQALDLVLADSDDAIEEQDEYDDALLSHCNHFKQDQVTLDLDLCDHSLHNQINFPIEQELETFCRSDFRVSAMEEEEEEEEVGFKCISVLGFGQGFDSDSVSARFRNHEDDDFGDDGNGDCEIESMLEETLSWYESSVFKGEEFFVGYRNFNPVSETGESSSSRNVQPSGSIDLDGKDQFDIDNKVSGSESNSIGFPLCLEEYGWEDVRIDEREILSQTRSFIEECINDNDEILISEIHSEQESGNASLEEPSRSLDWEVLLEVQDLNINSSDDTIEHNAESYMGDFVYTSEYEVLFGQFAENDNLQNESLPTSKSFVDNLPSVFLTQEDYDRNIALCAVCMENISKEELAKRLPCLHHYHGQCILPWLSIRNTCPVCRFELPTDDPDYERWVDTNSNPSENYRLSFPNV